MTERAKMRESLPVWRSALYVPVNIARFVARAARSAADAIQLDLEDGIAPSEKEAARSCVPRAVADLAPGAADVIVRINRPLGLAVRDIEVSVRPGVTALSLPKVESAEHVRLLSEVVADTERRAGLAVGTTKFILAIETAAAFFQMREIAASDPRVVAMLLGGEDFATDVGMTTSPENFLGPKQTLVIAAASAGIIPLGIVGSFANYRDIEGFRRMVRQSRALGFRGSSCIHPDQVAVLNEEFAPQPAELEAAQKAINGFEEAQSAHRGAVGLNDEMVDLPVVNRARALLAWNAKITARLARLDSED